MYTRIHIQNFRSLRDLEIADLGRVNLIVGANNAGKTSLLEALWLLHSPTKPRLTWALSVLRGLVPPPVTPELLWHWLFTDGSVATPISVGANDDKGHTLSLTLSVSTPSTQRLQRSAEQAGTVSAAATELLGLAFDEQLNFSYALDSETPATMAVQSSSEGLEVSHASPAFPSIPTTILSERSRLTAQDLSTMFTLAEDRGELRTLVDGLRILDGRVQHLSLGFAENRPLLRASLGNGRPVPIPFLGAGAVRLIEILLTLMNSTDGSVLVDEIENGLYYQSLEAVWRALDSASRAANVQVFATTHSYECIQAAVAAFSGKRAKDFRLHRLDRAEGGVEAVTYTHKLAKTAMNTNLEVR